MNELLRVSQPYIDTYLDISDANVILEEETFIYDGTEKEVKILSVIYKGKLLVEEKDYVVDGRYALNTGKYVLKIYGISNYGGVIKKNWYIKKKGSVNIQKGIGIAEIGITKTFTLSKIGDGNITINNNSNDKIAIPSYNKDTNIISIISIAEGETTFDIILNEGKEYTGDTIEISVLVSPYKPILADNDPRMISSAAQEKVASTLWAVGDKTAKIHISSFSNIEAIDTYAFIIQFDYYALRNSIPGILFQFGKTDDNYDIAFCDEYYNTNNTNSIFNFNYSDSEIGFDSPFYYEADETRPGWFFSKIRRDLCPLFYSALPIEWQNIINTTKHYSSVCEAHSSRASLQLIVDLIFLLSLTEITGSSDPNVSTSQSRYYYTQCQYYKNGNSKIKYKNTSINEPCNWWTSTYYYNYFYSNQAYYAAINSDGEEAKYYTQYKNTSLGFAPVFRVGGPQ